MLSQIQQELAIVVGRYIIDEVTAYSLVHPEFYEILLHYFVKKIPESLIAFGSNDFLQTRIQLEKSTNESSNFVLVVIEKNYAEIYFDRLIEEIKLKQFENAFQNMQVANVAYQEQLIQHIQKSDKVLHILASSCLPLILSVVNNSSELVRLILEKREGFNMSREVEIERQDDFDWIDYEDRKLLNLQSTINDEEIILMLACLCGSARVVEILLALEYDINYQNAMQKAPIHLACLRGNYEVVEVLLGIQSTGKEESYRQISLESDCDIDIQDANGLTALHMACRTCHTKVVNILLKKWKCSLGDTEEQSRIALFANKFSVTDNQRKIALHLAAESSSAADIFKILFQAISLSDCTGTGKHTDAIHEHMHICDLINIQDKDGKTILFTACENDNNDCVAFLLKYRCCKINICNDRNETPMFRACQNDNTKLVDILVKYNADVNFKDITGRTPLHVAVESKNKDMVKSILNNKICLVNLRDKNSYSALHLAIFGKNFEIVKTLLEADCYDKCDINSRDSNKNTPLMLAISADATHIVHLLIYNGCNLNKYNSEGKKAFHMACESNCTVDIIYFFLTTKPDFDLNCWDRFGRTGLHYAVIGNNIKAIKMLLKTNINLNKQDDDKETALHLAYRGNKLEIVNELLKSPSCDINLSNKAGESILHMACGKNEISVVRTLLRKNCAINAEDELGRTPLHIAMSSNFLDIFTVLVNKSDINAKYMNGWTPLHMACRQQCVAAVKLILQTACDVNITDNTGKTALHIAACGRESSIVKELLEINCNVNICDNKGKTAFSYALENHNKEVLRQFKCKDY